MFEQPEVQFIEFDNYPRRPSFIGHTVLDGATKGECVHIDPLGPLTDIYICVHVHVMYVYIHMHMRNGCLSVAVWLIAFSCAAVVLCYSRSAWKDC